MKIKDIKKLIIDGIEEAAGKSNGDLYREVFKNMPDSEFHQVMVDIRDKGYTFNVILPNFGEDTKKKYKNDTLKTLCEKRGIKLEHHLTYTGSSMVSDFTSNQKSLVLPVPSRKAVQTLEKGLSVTDGNTKRDVTTGQVTSRNKGAKITIPEERLSSGKDLKYMLLETMTARGGDEGMERALTRELMIHGEVSLEKIYGEATGVVSKRTLIYYMRAAGITINL